MHHVLFFNSYSLTDSVFNWPMFRLPVVTFTKARFAIKWAQGNSYRELVSQGYLCLCVCPCVSMCMKVNRKHWYQFVGQTVGKVGGWVAFLVFRVNWGQSLLQSLICFFLLPTVDESEWWKFLLGHLFWCISFWVLICEASTYKRSVYVWSPC